MINITIEDISIGNQSLDLYPDTSVTLRRNSSLFDPNSIPGSYSVSLKIPVNPANEKTFKFANRIPLSNNSSVYDCMLFVDGVIYVTGKLIIQRTTNRSFKAAIAIDRFPIDILDKRIRTDIDLGADENLGADTDAICLTAWNVSELSYPDTNFVFPLIWNKDFYGSANEDFQGLLNVMNHNTEVAKKNTIVTKNQYAISPQVFVKYVIDRIGISEGVAFDGTAYDDVDFSKLLFYNSYALDKLVGTYMQASKPGTHALVTVSPEFIWDDETSGSNQDPNNQYDNITGRFSAVAGDHRFFFSGGYRQTFLFSVGFQDFNHRLRIDIKLDSDDSIVYTHDEPMDAPQEPTNPFQELEIEFTIPLANDVYYFDLSFVRDTRLLNDGSITADQIFEGQTGDAVIKITQEYNGFEPILSYANHVPDISIKDVFLMLRGMNIIPVFNGAKNSISLEWAEDKLNERKVIDITDFVIRDESDLQAQYENQIPIDSGYELGYELDSDDQSLSDSNTHTKIIVGDGSINVVPTFTPMMMQVKDGIDTTPWRILVATRHQQGNSAMFNISNNFPLKLMFYHGLQPSILHLGFQGDYFFATSYDVTSEGDPLGDLSLRFSDSPNGLYESKWEQLLQYLSYGSLFDVRAILDMDTLNRLEQFSFVMIESQLFLIKEIRPSFDQDKIRETYLKLLKINPNG